MRLHKPTASSRPSLASPSSLSGPDDDPPQTFRPLSADVFKTFNMLAATKPILATCRISACWNTKRPTLGGKKVGLRARFGYAVATTGVAAR